MTENKIPALGDLRVFYVPQMPMPAFTVDAADLKTAVLLLDTLSRFSLFEYEQRVKPDYADAGGVQRYEIDGEGGFDWYDVDDGEVEELLAQEEHTPSEAEQIIEDLKPVLETKGIAAIKARLAWSSLHWGEVHPDAIPHLSAAVVEAVAADLRGAVEALLNAEKQPDWKQTAARILRAGETGDTREIEAHLEGYYSANALAPEPPCGDAPAPCNCDNPYTHNGRDGDFSWRTA